MRPQDKVFPDGARKIEVDVRHVAHGIGGQEALQRKVVLQGVDMGKADEIADQQGHRRAAPPSRRVFLERERGVGQPLLYHHLPPQLDDVVVKQQKAGQAVFFHQAELFLQPGSYLCGDGAVAPHGGLKAQLFQVGVGRKPVRRRVVGEGVAHLRGQIEAAPFRNLHGVVQGLGAFFEEGFQRGLRAQVILRVGAALAVAFLQALAVLDGHQAVLQLVPFPDVVMDVAGGHDPYPQLPG